MPTAFRSRSSGIEIDNDDVLVIHAMKLRARYRDDYHKVMECQHG
jgi:hypothetical protein